jgi:hypothetical protein
MKQQDRIKTLVNCRQNVKNVGPKVDKDNVSVCLFHELFLFLGLFHETDIFGFFKKIKKF